MSPVVTVTDLTKRYRGVTALDEISFSLTENQIHGLLGRNGAGRTTLMQILTAQNFATSGAVAVFGQHPYENERVLSRLSFIKESQTYPSNLRVGHVLRAGRPGPSGLGRGVRPASWSRCSSCRRDATCASSPGGCSSLGIIVGLASRADDR
ncbi:ATP-binding cassette domain-containing protein [Micromonospora sp. LOL_024]|uniref:ATP-binding cassette domain-containing protein n=1 Tax=Micromonospora sp. LOL_024 TaxID=3345412 RepID=UPI003A870408